MTPLSRRRLLQMSAGAAAGYLARPALAADPIPGERPAQDASVTVLNPRNRVPLSFIIDDSTCLVNLNHFSIPQFAGDGVSGERGTGEVAGRAQLQQTAS